MNAAYIYSLVDESKLDKFLVSVTSLKSTQTELPIYVMVDQKVSPKLLSLFKNLNVIPLSVNHGTLYPVYSSTSIFEKEIFSVIDCGTMGFEKLLYVDVNQYFIKNIDDVFNKLGGTMPYDPYATNTNHVSMWLYAITPYSTDSVKEIVGANKITCMRQWIQEYYDFDNRNKTKLPIEYSANLFNWGTYSENPLFNKSNVKVFSVYNSEVDILNIENLVSYDYRVQQMISNYITQYNLIIGMYKKLFPDLTETLETKERNF